MGGGGSKRRIQVVLRRVGGVLKKAGWRMSEAHPGGTMGGASLKKSDGDGQKRIQAVL